MDIKKFIIADNGEEINFGDEVLIEETISTLLDVARNQKLVAIIKGFMDELIKDGKVKVAEVNTTCKIWNNAIKSLTEKTNWEKKKLLDILDTLHLANPWVATQMVLKEIAIEIDKKYANHISKSKKIYTISLQDGRIHEIDKKTIKSYKAFPAFRSIDDAKIACSLIRLQLKSIFGNA